MKVRSGFVSNSSSSSFLIWGVYLSESKIRELLNLPEGGGEGGSVYSALDKRLVGTGLESHSPGYDSNHYIGLSWDKVKDDETGAQFKARVQEALTRIFGTPVECNTHEDAWHDG
jgi:hypothetical protein